VGLGILKNYPTNAEALREEVHLTRSNQQSVRVFPQLAVMGLGVHVFWQLCQFLSVSLPKKLRKIQLSKFFFLAPAKNTQKK
jgi:hypothetical protein